MATDGGVAIQSTRPAKLVKQLVRAVTVSSETGYDSSGQEGLGAALVGFSREFLSLPVALATRIRPYQPAFHPPVPRSSVPAVGQLAFRLELACVAASGDVDAQPLADRNEADGAFKEQSPVALKAQSGIGAGPWFSAGGEVVQLSTKPPPSGLLRTGAPPRSRFTSRKERTMTQFGFRSFASHLSGRVEGSRGAVTSLLCVLAALAVLLPVNVQAHAQEIGSARSLALQDDVRPLPEREIRPRPEPDPDPIDVEWTSQQLADVDDLFSGGGSEAVRFDTATAQERGIDPAVIALAEELAAFSNDLIRAADQFVNEGTVDPMADLSPAKYAMVSRFFRAASEFKRRQAESPIGRVQTTGWCRWYLTDAACTCGHWLYPQPTSAVRAKQYKNISNPTKTLKSWGYHQTTNLVGGGWTRAQTYYPSRCGTGTYRDHAWPGADGKSVWEQNYSGRTPRGEPNPEFWKSSVWAYPAWPTYVWWWHNNY